MRILESIGSGPLRQRACPLAQVLVDARTRGGLQVEAQGLSPAKSAAF